MRNKRCAGSCRFSNRLYFFLPKSLRPLQVVKYLPNTHVHQDLYPFVPISHHVRPLQHGDFNNRQTVSQNTPTKFFPKIYIFTSIAVCFEVAQGGMNFVQESKCLQHYHEFNCHIFYSFFAHAFIFLPAYKIFHNLHS